MVKYIGSKRRLVPIIGRIARSLPVESACDLFAGTTRVGQELRRAGLRVVSNDTASYSEAFGQAYIAADDAVDRDALRRTLACLNALPGRDGYVTDTFCHQARFFQPHNGRRIDAIREAIDAHARDPIERALLLTSLLEAADRVDSTTGVQMAYLKQWAPRSYHHLCLREPTAVPGPPGTVVRADAALLAPLLDTDLTYIDPPYNHHAYRSNYHVWETIVRNDAPEAYGVARKRVDCRTDKSAFNSRRIAGEAFARLVEEVRSPWLIVSFSNEGFHDLVRVQELLATRGHVARVEVTQPRYVGARIGIHNPRGERVGQVGHIHNQEMIFVVGPDRELVRRAARAGVREGGGQAVLARAGAYRVNATADAHAVGMSHRGV